jgi:uncharacterized protein (TIGR02265 family)
MSGSRRFSLAVHQPLTGDVDEAARFASIPEALMTKGMFLANLSGRLNETEARAVYERLLSPPSHGKYQSFHEYPFRDAMQWLHAVARKEHARVPLPEGLRRLGRDMVRVFLESKAGRVVKAMIAGPRESLMRMPQMWKVTDTMNEVVAEAIDDNTVRFEVHGFPGWIDCGLLGTLEQVVLNTGCEPSLDVSIHGASRATIVVKWEKDKDRIF